MPYSIAQQTNIGGRLVNADRCAYRETANGLLLVLADGLSAQPHSDKAAEIAVDYLCAGFAVATKTQLEPPELLLASLLAGAQQRIDIFNRESEASQPACTTIVCCLIVDGLAYWAHAGDSRCYLIRAGKVHERTEDHAQGHRLYRYLGGEQMAEMQYSQPLLLHRDDLILLCSDGIWGALDDAIMTATLSVTGSVAQAGEALLLAALQRAGSAADNATLMLLEWQSAAVLGYDEDLMSQPRLSDDEIERTMLAFDQAIRRSTL